MRREQQVGHFLTSSCFPETDCLYCSVSGRWMSSTQMEQDFAGTPSSADNATSKVSQVHLFLPAHHHVESIHFTASNGVPLHRAVAVVQTPGREYHILRDNGMQIGCEEDGIGLVWMKLLGCDASGVPR
ncbi:hypothetical protein PLICRDRAFT_113992 [Plicaturopsis crispa FD-325 SS-3]|nr:hypothetical protein PLICRDRAFT_113992 [Plicaturopsis crispa FD-325 SS-3]